MAKKLQQRIAEPVAEDPGPCDVMAYDGAGLNGQHVYCRNHKCIFVAPHPCPRGRTGLGLIKAGQPPVVLD